MAFNALTKIALHLIKLPAVLKGAKFAKDAFIAPGYDLLAVRWKGVNVGKSCLIGKRAWIQTCNDTASITIGSNTHIGRCVTISSKNKISIGSGCLFSFNVTLLDHGHEFKLNFSPIELGLTEGKEITIGNNCFIGAHTFILPGVSLGDNCIVGANSVVTRSFPAGTIIAGSPATEIKKLA